MAQKSKKLQDIIKAAGGFKESEYTRLLEEQAAALEEEGKPEEAEALREEARKEEPKEKSDTLAGVLANRNDAEKVKEKEADEPGLAERIGRAYPGAVNAVRSAKELASGLGKGVVEAGQFLPRMAMGDKSYTQPEEDEATKRVEAAKAAGIPYAPPEERKARQAQLDEAKKAGIPYAPAPEALVDKTPKEEPSKTAPARKPAKEPALPLQRPFTREEAAAAGEIEKAPTLQEKIGLLRTELKQAGEDRDRLRKIADYGELASIIGRSLAQIGAAQAGLKAGIDLSGVAQKSLINWDAKRQEISDDYKQRVSEIQSEQKDIQRQIERAEDKEDRDQLRKEDFDNKMKIVRLQMNQKANNAAAKQLLKSTTAAMRGDKEAIKQQQDAIKVALTDTDKQISTLTNLANQLKFGDKKGKEVSVKQKAAELAGILGAEKIEVDEVFGDDLLDKEDALALLQERLADLTATRDQYVSQSNSLNKMEVELLRGGASAPVSQPTAPSQSTPVKSVTREDVKKLALRDGISEDEAKQRLEILGVTIRD